MNNNVFFRKSNSFNSFGNIYGINYNISENTKSKKRSYRDKKKWHEKMVIISNFIQKSLILREKRELAYQLMLIFSKNKDLV